VRLPSSAIESRGGGPSRDGALAGAVTLGHRPPGSPPVCMLCLDSDGIDGPGHAAPEDVPCSWKHLMFDEGRPCRIEVQVRKTW